MTAKVLAPAPAGRRYSGEAELTAFSGGPLANWPASVVYIDPCPCLDPAGAHVPRCGLTVDLPSDGEVSDGFAWGYGGSGAAQLARSILIDVLAFDPPASLVAMFKELRVAVLDPLAPWALTAGEVRRWAADAARLDPWAAGWRGCLCADVDNGKPTEDGHLPGCPAHSGFEALL